MPRLYLFVPCERVLLEDDKVASLMRIIEALNVTIPTNEPLPEDAAIPQRWNIYAYWRRSPNEEGIRFDQKFDLALPDKTIIHLSTVSFPMEGESHKIKVESVSFPIFQEGRYVLSTAIRPANTDDRWELAGEYPIDVRHVTADEASVTDAADG